MSLADFLGSSICRLLRPCRAQLPVVFDLKVCPDLGGGVALSLVEDAHLAEHLAGAEGGQDNVAVVAHFGDFDGPESDFIRHVARPAFAEDHVAVVEGFFRFLQIGVPKGFFVPFFQALKSACLPSHPVMLPTPGLGVNAWPEIKPK